MLYDQYTAVSRCKGTREIIPSLQQRRRQTTCWYSILERMTLTWRLALGGWRYGGSPRSRQSRVVRPSSIVQSCLDYPQHRDTTALSHLAHTESHFGLNFNPRSFAPLLTPWTVMFRSKRKKYCITKKGYVHTPPHLRMTAKCEELSTIPVEETLEKY